MNIDELIHELIGREGGYVHHPADRGGPTPWGITQRVARANGYGGDMRHLPRDEAAAIYRRLYWLRPRFDQVAEEAPRIAAELFDTGVNMGPAVPSLWFQQALNGLNNGGKLYADIKEDGDIGPATLAAFRAYRKARGAEADTVMLRALNGLQAARYIELARGRVANEAFLYGWLRTRVAL